MSEQTFWYRYEDRLYSAGVDEFDNPLGPAQVHVNLYRYKVVKETPKGVWLDIGTFVNREWRKRFACPTEQEAYESFRARKIRQIGILEAQIHNAKRALTMLENQRCAVYAATIPRNVNKPSRPTTELLKT